MITENLSTLKIHKLTQEQYDRELAAGNIDETALYLTPDNNDNNYGIKISEYIANIGNSCTIADSKFYSFSISDSGNGVQTVLIDWQTIYNAPVKQDNKAMIRLIDNAVIYATINSDYSVTFSWDTLANYTIYYIRGIK